MSRHKQEPEREGSSERWMLTYSDLITLLMIFFVIMYSMSNVNAKKFSQLSSSLNKSLLGQGTGILVGEAPGPSMINGAVNTEQSNLQKAQSQIEKYAKERGLQGKITVSLDGRGLVISLKEALLFNSGSADLALESRTALYNVGKIIAALPNALRIEGNTDNIPIHSDKFPSNWFLSATRAINVVNFLIVNAGIKPEKLSVIGYGEYRPIVPNNTEANRAQNRRVDIVVLKQALNLAEAGNNSNR